jgi:Lipase (class 3)
VNIDWSKAKLHAQLVQIAGQVTSGDYSVAVQANIQALGYSFLESIIGNDFHGVTATFGFVALAKQSSDASGQVVSGGECVCALRGTAVKDLLEWLDDIDAIPVPSPFGHGVVHLGFKDVYNSLRLMRRGPNWSSAASISAGQYIDSLFATGQATSAVITGHSLGGALATLVTMEVKTAKPFSEVQSYTFASPRVGDHAFMNWYDLPLRDWTYRVENCFDAVPNLPTNPPYEHVNTKFRVVGDFLEPVWKQHELGTYLALIEKHL